MKKSIFRAAALSMIMIFAGTGILSAQAVTFNTQQNVPLPPSFFNTCTGENMTYVSGSAQQNIHGVTLPSGLNMVTYHFFTQGIVYVGDDSGDTYVINENALQKDVTKDMVLNATFTDYFRVIGKGKAANLRQKIEQSLMVDFNTNPPTVVFSPVTFVFDSCK